MHKVKLSAISEIKSGKANSQDALDEGEYPLFDRSREIKASDIYIFDKESVILPGEGKDFYPRYYSGKFNLHQRAYSISSKNEKIVTTKFLYFLLIKHREYFSATATGATVKSLRLPQIGALEVLLPNIDDQNYIVSILSDYENLIDTNLAKINILEKTLHLLYEETFNSDPMHEKWPLKKLSEYIEVFRGVSYSSEEIDEFEGEYNLINLKNFNKGGGFRSSGTKYYSGSVNNFHHLQEGDIVVAVTDMTHDRVVVARPARIPKLEGATVFSADLVKVTSSILPNSYLYQLLSGYRFTETTKYKANGSNVLHLKPTAIGEFEFNLPPIELIKNYDKLCQPVIDDIHSLLNQNFLLSKMFNNLLEYLFANESKNE